MRRTNWKESAVTILKKTVSFILVFVCLCFNFCSCSKSKDYAEQILADSLWFDSERYELYPFPESKVGEVYHTVFHYNDGDIYVVIQYYVPPTEEEIESTEFDESNCYRTDLCIFDENGLLNKRIDINRVIVDNVDTCARIRSFGFLNNSLYILSEIDGEHSEDIISIIDIDSDSIIESISFTSELMRTIRTVYSEELVLVTDDIFMLCSDSSEILLFDKDGNYRTDSFYDIFNRDMFLGDAYSDNNGTVKFSCSNGQNQMHSIALGANTIVYEALNFEVGNAFNAKIADNGTCYSVGNEGIAKYNEETSAFDMMIPPESFNINYNELVQLTVLSVTDEEFLLVNTHVVDLQKGIVAYKLTKSETNPNAGKNKLIVGLFGDYIVSPAIGKAVYDINKYDLHYFATIRVYDYKSGYYEDNDVLEMVRQEEADRLMRDILDGKGPDIIINAFDILELCDEGYLCDLNEFIDDDEQYNPNDYVSSVIELANTEGKLYQMPLLYGTKGISAPSEYAPNSRIGYSFEEYSSIVADANNGADALAYQTDRSGYYSLLFTAMSSDFHKSGKWNLDCQEYRALVDYCKEKVPMKCLANYDDEDFVLPDFTLNNPQIEGIRSYISNIYSRGYDLYGYPSSSGNHGVMISVFSSAAISSHSMNKEHAWNFIKALMSYEIQCEETVYSPINAEALYSSGKEAVKVYNEYNAELRTMDIDKLLQMGIRITDDIDDSSIESYIELLSNATEIYRIDGQILLISKEEVQAVYSEQKSIDDVVDIMNNRISTYIEERF